MRVVGIDFAVRTLGVRRRHLQETMEWFQHNDATRKLNSIVQYVRKHPVVFTLLGSITLGILTPILIISCILMAPFFVVVCSLMAFLGGILLVLLSFVFGFLVNFLLFAVAIAASCYLSYYIARDAICRARKLLFCFASCPSKMHHCLRSTLFELGSQLLEGISGDLGQRLQKGTAAKMDGKGHMESDSSELEDIEPDYRDRESKIYDALVGRQNTEGDTFQPFPY